MTRDEWMAKKPSFVSLGGGPGGHLKQPYIISYRRYVNSADDADGLSRQYAELGSWLREEPAP